MSSFYQPHGTSHTGRQAVAIRFLPKAKYLFSRSPSGAKRSKIATASGQKDDLPDEGLAFAGR
jgi:hypothetical protein